MIFVISVPDTSSLQSSGPCRYYAGGTVHLDGDGPNGDNEGGEVCQWPGERCPYLDSRSVACPLCEACTVLALNSMGKWTLDRLSVSQQSGGATPLNSPQEVRPLCPGQRVHVTMPGPLRGIEGRIVRTHIYPGFYQVRLIGAESPLVILRVDNLGVLG